VVTGVAGFVGSHLAERLLALGYHVVGVDNFSSGYPKNMASFFDHPAFLFHERSVCEAGLLADLRSCHTGLDLVCFFHLAAIVSVPYSLDHPEETMEVNLGATTALLREAEGLDSTAFVFAGSAAEYGNDERLPLIEEYAGEDTVHVSPYGRAKFLASRAVAASPHGVALRCFNIYGPRQDPGSPYSGVISRFADKAAAGEALTIFGDGQQTRDFIYVSDVVEAYIHAAGLARSASAVPNGIYNVGTGKGTSVLELAQIVIELTGNRKPITFLPERPGDIRLSVASVAAFQKTAGWRPTISLADGLRRTLGSVTSSTRERAAG